MLTPTEFTLDTRSPSGHQCQSCGKIFVSSKGLQQHSIVHTDRKPFVCEICNKPFRFKSNLFEHRSIHTGETPYVCPFCSKACRLKGNLKKHLKTHLKEPEEIDRAYEAVTGVTNTNDNFSSVEENGSYDSPYMMYKSTPKRKKLIPSRRFLQSPSSSTVTVHLAQEQDDEPYVKAPVENTLRLEDMFGDNYGVIEMATKAREINNEAYKCRACHLIFPNLVVMRTHCYNIHNYSEADSEEKQALKWCEKCMCCVEDEKMLELHEQRHATFHEMLKAEELVVNEPHHPMSSK